MQVSGLSASITHSLLHSEEAAREVSTVLSPVEFAKDYVENTLGSDGKHHDPQALVRTKPTGRYPLREGAPSMGRQLSSDDSLAASYAQILENEPLYQSVMAGRAPAQYGYTDTLQDNYTAYLEDQFRQLAQGPLGRAFGSAVNEGLRRAAVQAYLPAHDPLQPGHPAGAGLSSHGFELVGQFLNGNNAVVAVTPSINDVTLNNAVFLAERSRSGLAQGFDEYSQGGRARGVLALFNPQGGANVQSMWSLHEFNAPEDAHRFLTDAANLQQITSRATLHDQEGGGLFDAAFARQLQGLAFADTQAQFNTKAASHYGGGPVWVGDPGVPDLGALLLQQNLQHLLSNGDTLLKSSSEESTQLFNGIAGALLAVLAPFAPMVGGAWGAALNVGLGALDTASTGLGIDEAVHGDTQAERQGAAVGALLGGTSAVLGIGLTGRVKPTAPIAQTLNTETVPLRFNAQPYRYGAPEPSLGNLPRALDANGVAVSTKTGNRPVAIATVDGKPTPITARAQGGMVEYSPGATDGGYRPVYGNGTADDPYTFAQGGNNVGGARPQVADDSQPGPSGLQRNADGSRAPSRADSESSTDSSQSSASSASSASSSYILPVPDDLPPVGTSYFDENLAARLQLLRTGADPATGAPDAAGIREATANLLDTKISVGAQDGLHSAEGLNEGEITVHTQMGAPFFTQMERAGYNPYSNPRVSDTFETFFSNAEWQIESAFRHGANDMPYYASDVLRYQYTFATSAAQSPMPFGTLPSRIVHTCIVNRETIEVISDSLRHHPTNAQLLQDYLQLTPNGRMTQRILDDFGLEPVALELSGPTYGFPGEKPTGTFASRDSVGVVVRPKAVPRH